MDYQEEQIFLMMLSEACAALGNSVAELKVAGAREDAQLIHQKIHTVLSHAGTISNGLWPGKNKDKARREYLGKTLGIPESHVLADRDLRHNIQHIDERIRDWILERKGHDYADQIVSAVRDWPVPLTDTLRFFDPETCIFYFRGEAFPLPPVVDGAGEVFKAVQKRMRALQEEQWAAKRGASEA